MLIDMLTGLVDHPTGIGVAQPAGHGGHVIQALAGGDSGHGAAVGMPADHDVADFQGRDGVLHRGGHTARLRAVGRHDIASIADDEQVARLTLCDQLRHQPAVGARDE